MNEKNTIWESAGKAGLVLGGVSILYLALNSLITHLAGEDGSVLLSLVNVLLWLVKFGGCIFLMRFFMLRYAEANPGVDNRQVFRFGMLTALLSALLYSAAHLAYMTFIAPDMTEQVMEVLEENPMFDSNMRAQMEQMMPKMPTYTFFGNLIYCFLFGTILSAIFSNNIPPKNPFKE